jgi:hypothetical protein
VTDLKPRGIRLVDQFPQRVVSRNRLSYHVPLVLFWFLMLDVVWEVIKENRPANPSPPLPWWITVFNLNTAATAAGILGSLLLARTQFARAIRPSLGFNNTAQVTLTSSKRLTLPCRWTVNMINAGPGTCTVVRCEWRYAVADEELEDLWMSWDEVVESLAQRGLVYGKHYYLVQLGPGAVFPVSSDPDHELEIACLSERAVSLLRALELRTRVIDMAGDIHERVGHCMYSAHSITGIPLAQTAHPLAEPILMTFTPHDPDGQASAQ